MRHTASKPACKAPRLPTSCWWWTAGSTDDTVAIAQRLGAEVHSYPDWKGFAVQRTDRLLAHARVTASSSWMPTR